MYYAEFIQTFYKQNLIFIDSEFHPLVLKLYNLY